MERKGKMKLRAKLLFTVFILFLFVYQVTTVCGDNSNNPPNGIEIDNIFQTPEGANSSVIKTGLVDIVEVTANQKNQAGAIWNTDNNIMDLTTNFEASMYLYFGDKSKDAADGMAFVMQADPNGNKAFRTGEGARLGVWDSTKSKEFGLAIKNSIAIEFDTYYNKGFDDDVKRNKNHIAWNYPGEKSTYNDPWLGTRTMHHNDLQYPTGDYFSDDQWHKFSVKWDVITSTLTYQFESLNPIAIPIDVDSIFGTSQVYWGFTGSTGGSFASNRVVFEKVPGLVEGQVSEEVVDKNTGLSVKNNQVVSEAVLTHSVDVLYQSGKQDWKEIQVLKTINNNVQYIPGSLRSIDVNGDETALADSYWTGNDLNLSIGDLNLENNQKRIVFDVKVKPVSVDTEVGESVRAKGKNYISGSENVNYTIISNVAPILTLENTGLEMNIEDGTDVEVRGTWLDKNSETISLYYQLNEADPTLFEKDSPNNPKDTSYSYLTLIPASTLVMGQNDIKIWAVDKEGAKSNVEAITVHVRGTLKFSSVPDFDFGQFSIPVKNQLIFPITEDAIKLSDTRGVGSGWELNVKLKKTFTSLEGNTLDNFYYVDENNQKQLLQVDELVHIRTDVTQESNLQEINWAPNQGIALEIFPSSFIGDYSSELEWILEDTPTS